MKKIILTLILLLVPFVFSADAAEQTKTLVFAWDQENLNLVKQWEMHWGVTAGGPYSQLALIPFPGGGPSFESPVAATVTGNSGTFEKRFFVLRACGDVPVEAGGTEYQCSAWSNEVAYDFWIPAAGYTAPIQFRIISQ